MGYAAYRQFSALHHRHHLFLLLLLLLSPRSVRGEHFPKPHRDTRVGPFDARCCRGYWIKVSRFAEEIISRAAHTARAATSCTLSPPVALRSFFCRNHHTAALARRPERNLPATGLPFLPPSCYLLDFLDLSCFSIDKTRGETPPGT